MTDKDYLLITQEISKSSTERVPCACIIVQNGEIITKQFNSQRADELALHHAEVKAVYRANQKTGKRKLEGATAYCTCEPCAMCLVAMSYAKIERIVFSKKMKDLFPDDPQSDLDSEAFIKTLNFVPKLEQLLI
jgi:guanine deaminase